MTRFRGGRARHLRPFEIQCGNGQELGYHFLGGFQRVPKIFAPTIYSLPIGRGGGKIFERKRYETPRKPLKMRPQFLTIPDI